MSLPSIAHLNLTALWWRQPCTFCLPRDYSAYLQLLQTCILKNAPSQGKNVHSFIAQRRFAFATRTTFHKDLISTYVKCGCLADARKVFDHMKERDSVSWNTIISAYRRNGYPHEALTLFHQMQRTGFLPDQFTFASVLPACAKMGALEQGMDIHRSITDRGFLADIIVGNALVNMYAKCGLLNNASELFDRMLKKNVFSWNAMIAGYAQNGFVERALETFKQMQLAGVEPNTTTFVCILPACAKIGALEQGMEIHQGIEDKEISSDVVVATVLVDMYAKCGSIDKARELFDKMPQRNVISWTAMIAGYVQNGLVEKALETFNQMQLAGVEPNSTTFASILPACAKMGALEQGMSIHQSIKDRRILSNVVVATALVDMYSKCGNIDTARELFNGMTKKNAISWNAMISGYAQNGFVEKSLETFEQMQLAGVKPNSTTFAIILPACAKMGALQQGKGIHQSIKDIGFLSDVVVTTALVDMYAKCGRIDKAHELFEKMPQKDAVSWNAMVAGYAQNGFVEKALETFKQMQLAGVTPNSTTFASILSTCAKIGALEQGMSIHKNIIERGFLSDIIVGNGLVDLYAKCARIDKARDLFDRMPQRDVISWNAMIAGYMQNGIINEALETFKQTQLADVKPNSTTFANILPACAKMGALEHGIEIHQSIIEGGFLSDIIVGNALVDMYAKCGSLDKAQELFDRMPVRDVISWTAMVTGYAQNGFVEKALETFKQMQLAGVKPNSMTFASILPACAKMGALEQGMNLHRSIMVGGFLSDIVVGNALVDMYAKCGSIEKARELFDIMPERDVISWNAMIAGYAQNGLCKDALKTFDLMNHFGIYPNIVSFSCVLCACSHAGLVDEGCTYFNHMSNSYSITPTVDHYVCMVDLLSRAGYLENTLNFVFKMPIQPVAVVWMCFLGACRSHMNTGLGVFTAALLLDLDPKNAATYVLLSNIYAEVGRWGEAQIVRRLMKDRGIRKSPGCSWIEGHKMVHAFSVADRSHPQTREIYAKLEKLDWEMKAAGYFPHSRHLLNDVEEE